MASTVQVNVRIDKDLKIAGDDVMRRYGCSPSKAVQSLWNYIVVNNSLPDFIPKIMTPTERNATAIAEKGRGMAARLFSDMTEMAISDEAIDSLAYDNLREIEWEDRGSIRCLKSSSPF